MKIAWGVFADQRSSERMWPFIVVSCQWTIYDVMFGIRVRLHISYNALKWEEKNYVVFFFGVNDQKYKH